MVIDIHAHFTAPPPALEVYRSGQLMDGPRPRPFRSDTITDEQIVSALTKRQLLQMREKGSAWVILSPQANAMGHHFGGELTSRYWSQACNDLVHRASQLFPDKLLASCQLPQSPGVEPRHWLDELEFRVAEQGFVGCNLNPDISGGVAPLTPSVADEWWYPVWDKLQALNVPAHMHASATLHPGFHVNGSHYTAWDHAAAFDLMWASEQIFRDFPRLKLVITHAGGAVILQYNRMRAIFERAGKDYDAAVRRLWWDLAVYEVETMQTMLKVIGPERIMFATEMCGTADVVNPRTDRKYDDTLPFLDTLDLEPADRSRILEGNAREVYDRAPW
jgi:4-oxalmesaconate hydratase